MAARGPDPGIPSERWVEREARVTQAFTALAERVRGRVANLDSRGTTSSNRMKPLHVVRTFGRPERPDEGLVLSTMFRTQGGTLQVDCDLMQEDAEIVRDLGHIDLGAGPAENEIEAAVDAVVEFANEVEGTLVEFFGT